MTMQVEANSREAFLAEKADAIRSLAKNVVRDVIEIGRHLSEAKGKFGRGGITPSFWRGRRTRSDEVKRASIASSTSMIWRRGAILPI